ncbi:MAG: SDR family NAD(P)-dependent oxidoreductase [Clostridia bacterium]|nr:SDR family NAD(P)-dependent oxidoreductase [Clostridia bacterium]
MKIAIITGASSGLGKEFAIQIDRQEKLDEIWLIARDRGALSLTASALRTKSRIIDLDLSKQENRDSFSNLLKTEAPYIKILVNAAGFGKIGATEIIAKQDIKDMIEVNICALTDMCLAARPFMHAGSRIINMASVSGFIPLPYLNVYAATKAFVLRFSQGLHDELKSKGIAVTAVCPYWVDTNFIPVAKNSPGAKSVTNFPFITKAQPVVQRALCDNRKGNIHSFFGFASNTVHVLAHIMPVCAQMAVWNMIRR